MAVPAETQPTPEQLTERRLNAVYDTYGGNVQGDALASMAEAAAMNADVLFQQGLPDKAEAEGMRANKLRADGGFLLSLAQKAAEQPK